MTDSATPVPRFALLLNGANFACEVLQALLQRQFAPMLLVLPEYAPATAPAEQLLAQRPQRRLQQLAGTIPFAYAPQTEQARCARLLRRQAADFLLVACWPYLISPQLIGSAAKAALNLHPSLLPAYRGPDPITQQIDNGERDTGVTLHRLNERFDAGDIVAQARLPQTHAAIDRATFEGEAARLGSELFIDAISGYDGGWQTRAQPQ